MILVSSCLVGINCKYSGGNNYNEKVFQLLKDGNGILVDILPKNGIEVINSDEF